MGHERLPAAPNRHAPKRSISTMVIAAARIKVPPCGPTDQRSTAPNSADRQRWGRDARR